MRVMLQRVGRVAWGATLVTLGVSERARTRVPGVPDVDDPVATRLLVVLGVRHLAQTCAEVAAPFPVRGMVRRAGHVVDALHVASLPLLAAIANPEQRRWIAWDAPIETLIARAGRRQAKD